VPNQSDPIVWTEAGVPLWPPKRDTEDPVSHAARDAAKARRDEERRRLLYVAMTRAEDRLYVCGWQGQRMPPADCWYATIRAAMPGLAQRVTDLPVEGEGFRLETSQRVAPQPDRDDAQRLPAPQRNRPGWANAAPKAEAAPRPLTPSRPDGEEPPVRPPLQPDGRDAFRRGILIHRLLQALPDLPPDSRRAAALSFLTREEAEAPDAIVAEVLAVLDDARFAALFQPGARAEVALTARFGGRLISGQVDRLAVTDREVLVIDYKSNRPPPGDVSRTPALYLRQMAAYRSVLERIYPGKSIRCAILWTAAPALFELPPAMLDPYAVDLADPPT
jgi:ATP-dependent helicase/nuclease subunit A